MELITTTLEVFCEGRATVSQGEELPVGTYYYIIEYLDTNKNIRQQKTGYLYLNR